MFNNCYRPGCHFDMNRCRCPKCNRKNNWEEDYDDERNNNSKCCYPIDINFSVENRNNQNDYNDFNDNDYDYDYTEKNQYEKTNHCKKCHLPLDLCFSIKEGRRDYKEYQKDDRRDSGCDDDFNHYCRRNDRCHQNQRPCQNRNNNCFLGLGLLGCLCRNNRRYY